MKKFNFDDHLTDIKELSEEQRLCFFNDIEQANSVAEIVKYLEKHLEAHPRCPECQHEDLFRWGKQKALQRYRCKKCLKTFTALTDTPLVNLRKTDLWDQYLESMQHSDSLRASADHCDIHLTTAFRWRHRVLELIDYLKKQTDTPQVSKREQ